MENILIIIIFLLFGIVIGKKLKSTNSITENFSQSYPMNVMYSDENGNLSTTTDVGLQNLTISNNGALLLGNKFCVKPDIDFLRMINNDNTGYYGGFATGKLYSAGDTKVDGKLILPGDTDVKTMIDELYTKIDTISTTLSNSINTISSRVYNKIDTLLPIQNLNTHNLIAIRNVFSDLSPYDSRLILPPSL